MHKAGPHPQGAIRDHLLSRQGASRDHLLIGRAAGPAEAEADQPARSGPNSSASGGAAADTREDGTEPGGAPLLRKVTQPFCATKSLAPPWANKKHWPSRRETAAVKLPWS